MQVHAHEIVLRGPRFLGGGEAPVVLRLADQRFLPTLFQDLRDPERRTLLQDKLIPASDPILYLPVHRTFNVLLAEAYCEVPGKPRVDPVRIDSAGVVIRRRVPRKSSGSSGPQRWVVEDETVLGWQALLADSEDPEAERRPRVGSGHPAVEAALQRTRPRQARLSETVTKMYVAPPDVCAAVGATLLFGVIEAASPERAERRRRPSTQTPQGPSDPAASYTSTEIRSMVPAWLLARTEPAPIPTELRGRTFRVVNTGSSDLLKLEVQFLDAGTWRELEVPTPWTPLGRDLQSSTLTDLRHFVRMLSQLQLQWEAWTGPAVSSLRATLQSTTVTLPGGASSTLDEVLQKAAAIFVLREEGVTVTFPEVWPVLAPQTMSALEAGIKQALEGRLERFIRHEGRFERPEARYHMRAFARVKREPGCPPDLVWSGNTPEYRVARWFEGAPEGAVLPTIELPSIDRGFLKNLRPNVTLKVPRSLFNFLQNNAPEDFLGGDARNDTSGPNFQWICGFNISIIFMIAFMLLITFVFLLNIVFWWVAFFRVCIPLPGGLFDEGEE
jgi:hypothetical protein